MDHFEEKMRVGAHKQVHIILDEDKKKWKNHYDPDMEILFGKGGLPNQLWRGESIFDNLETSPAIVQQVVADHCEDVRARTLEDAEEDAQETGEPCEPQLEDDEVVAARRLQAMKDKQLIRMAVFSKTKFSKDLSDAEVLSKFTSRYQRAVPLSCVDCVLVHSLEKKKPESKPETASEEQQPAASI